MLLLAALTSVLADALLERHPERAADVLERLDPDETAALLARTDSETGAEVLRQLSPRRAAAVLKTLGATRAAALLDVSPLDEAARLLRALDDEAARAVLESVGERRARLLRAGLRFPAHTAGALMDPEVLALPASLTAREALERVRDEPEHAHYNVYVIDSGQRLVGALTLRELFLGRADARLDELMVRAPLCVRVDADRAAVVSHPGWRSVHALPVVDPAGRFVGALRYRTLRELEEALLRRGGPDISSAAALGDLFATGAAALLDALAAPVAGGARGGR
jgi:magnesium transporter